MTGIALAVGGTKNHVHLLLKLRASRSLSDTVRKVKANSSKWVNEEWGRRGRFSWQSGYGAFSVSESQVLRVVQYVKNQKKHHRVVSFQEEFRTLLKSHQIAWDERYLWG